jgi:signal transduction histidine kinase
VNFTGSDDLKDLSHTKSLALFHICQEALANVAKHAKAKNVQVAVWTTPERVLLEITDDGKGFDLEQVKTSIGHGLANMQTRAHAVGGEVDISSTIKGGTTILVWVPRAIRH